MERQEHFSYEKGQVKEKANAQTGPGALAASGLLEASCRFTIQKSALTASDLAPVCW